MINDAIVGVAVGAIIGFASSYFMWKVQIKHNRKTVAKGFYLEISSLEEHIERFARLFDAPGPGAGLVEIKQPFYSDGLFFVFRKEIFGFNQDLSEGLFEFYNCLLTADKNRKVAHSDQFFTLANDAMKSSIKKAYNLLPNLKELLKKEFS